MALFHGDPLWSPLFRKTWQKRQLGRESQSYLVVEMSDKERWPTDLQGQAT